MKKKTRTTAWAISSKNNQIIITTASATIARPWRPCYVGHQYIFIGSVENCSLIIWHEKCLADENPLWWYVMQCGWRSGLVCAWESEMKHGGVWCHVSPYAACPNLTHTMSCWLKRAYSRVKVFECTCLYHIQSVFSCRRGDTGRWETIWVRKPGRQSLTHSWIFANAEPMFAEAATAHLARGEQGSGISLVNSLKPRAHADTGARSLREKSKWASTFSTFPQGTMYNFVCCEISIEHDFTKEQNTRLNVTWFMLNKTKTEPQVWA